ncbi:MAG: RdgB/HAM1 family non-canonical purine NTP pyrophosphatase [Acidobacteria bacterium]|nr:RdgB/HAM1 family non-canonical purine NTP pyrophosphatase [Acidobacteriota bacterium]
MKSEKKAQLRRLLFATNNPGKQREIKRILKGLPLEIVFPGDIGIKLDPEETGGTFQENAFLKAEAFAKKAPGMMVAAEDSGLVVPALGGEPGVRSARYGGTRDNAAHNALLLEKMRGLEGGQRAAYYEAVVVLLDETRRSHVFSGRVNGEIALEPKGSGGFGYDPVFFSAELGRTFGEAPARDKDRLSHRGKALRALKRALVPILSRNAGPEVWP